MPTPSAFAISLPARPESVTVVRHVIAGVADVWTVTRELLDDVQIAVGEACANVVTHAYRDRGPGSLEVRGSTVDGRIVVAVRDNGPGITPRTDSPGIGMGLPLMGALTERLETGFADDGAHEVRLYFPAVPT